MLRQLAQTLIGGVRRAADRLAVAAVAAERGTSMGEYAIVLGLVAIVAMVAVQALGVGVGQVFTNILGKITGIAR